MALTTLGPSLVLAARGARQEGADPLAAALFREMTDVGAPLCERKDQWVKGMAQGTGAHPGHTRHGAPHLHGGPSPQVSACSGVRPVAHLVDVVVRYDSPGSCLPVYSAQTPSWKRQLPWLAHPPATLNVSALSPDWLVCGARGPHSVSLVGTQPQTALGHCCALHAPSSCHLSTSWCQRRPGFLSAASNGLQAVHRF